MIKIADGDVLNSSEKIIAHQVNCLGIMGGGIARQIKEKYPEVYNNYKYICDLYNNDPEKLLGKNLCVETNSVIFIVNCFAQNGIGRGKCQTDYDAFRKCMRGLNNKFNGARIAMPYNIGCGLAGGDWSIVYKIIEDELKDCEVVLYRWN